MAFYLTASVCVLLLSSSVFAQPYMTTFEGPSDQTQCNLEPGVTKTTTPATCNECVMQDLYGHYIITCDAEDKATAFSYGCNSTCGDCEKTAEPISECFWVSRTPENSTDDSNVWTKIEATPRETECYPDRPNRDNLVYFVEYDREGGFDENATDACRLSNVTTRTSRMVEAVNGKCAEAYGSYYDLNRNDTDGVVTYVGGAECEVNCTTCALDIDSWKEGSCNALGANYYLIAECPPNDGPSRSNVVPDELLAVGILVLVIATFFLIQACHKASKKKRNIGSLNSDRESSSLIADDHLTRDYTGRVSFNKDASSSIVRAEAVLRGEAPDATPIVASERIAAAIHAEKVDRSKGGFRPVQGVKTMKI